MPNTSSINSGTLNAQPPFTNGGRLTVTAPATLTAEIIKARLAELEIAAAAELTLSPTIHSNVLPLPTETVWLDEWSWAPVKRTQTRMLAGNLYILKQTKTAGRPLTLSLGWISRATLTNLEAWRDNAEVESMTVILPDTRIFQAQWRDIETPIEVVPVPERTIYEDADYFSVKLYLMTV